MRITSDRGLVSEVEVVGWVSEGLVEKKVVESDVVAILCVCVKMKMCVCECL